MIAAKSLLRSLPKAQLAANQARHMSVISTPPTVRISFAEKVAHGVAITAGILAIPCWILVNIKNYRGQ